MNKKQKVVFIIFTSLILTLVYKVIPDVITLGPIFGLIIVYVLIIREEEKLKLKDRVKKTKLKLKKIRHKFKTN